MTDEIHPVVETIRFRRKQAPTLCRLRQAMKKLVFALVLFIALIPAALFANGAGETADQTDDGQYKVALIIENTIDDRGWCQSMHEGILGAMEPVTAVVIGACVFGESFTTTEAAGIALILIAVVLIILTNRIKEGVETVMKRIRPRHV